MTLPTRTVGALAERTPMPYITTQDDTKLYFKDWGQAPSGQSDSKKPPRTLCPGRLLRAGAGDNHCSKCGFSQIPAHPAAQAERRPAVIA